MPLGLVIKIEASDPVSSSTMTSVSRQYLQELPEMKRRERQEQELRNLFQLINNPLMAAAELGETKYLFDMGVWVQGQQQRLQNQQHHREMLKVTMLGQNAKMMHVVAHKAQAQPTSEGPSEELLAGLREKFPGCSVSLQEDWVETRQGVKELKKGIMIDWS